MYTIWTDFLNTHYNTHNIGEQIKSNVLRTAAKVSAIPAKQLREARIHVIVLKSAEKARRTLNIGKARKKLTNGKWQASTENEREEGTHKILSHWPKGPVTIDLLHVHEYIPCQPNTTITKVAAVFGLGFSHPMPSKVLSCVTQFLTS